MATPFTISVPDERISAIRAKVASFAWAALPDAGGWESGVGTADLKRLVDHWLTRFDWRAQEERLNVLPQFTTEALGQRLHFIHARGDGSAAPLLLLHGWPGSFVEFEALIAPLVADGHDVVVPSLPGYAFSGRPASPIGPRRTGEIMHELMRQLFGKTRYLVQGGDWGAAIGSWMSHDHPEAVAALHLNMVIIQAEDAVPRRPQELAWAARRAKLAKEETGYSQEQATRPQTLGVAMSDSPVGVAAWILEKFGAWADVPRDEQGRPDLWRAFNEDTLLTNIMLYLVEGSFVTSTWMYRGRVLEGSGQFPMGTRIKVPTAVAAFPDPVFPPPPRSQIAKTYDVVQWTEMAAGGHFAALEQPQLLLADMRRFFADRSAAEAREGRGTALGAIGIAAASLAAVGLYTHYATKRIERMVPADGKFVDVAGARVHYVDRGAGNPIVLLHGLGAQLRNFDYGVTDALASDHRVIVMDRPGSGYSEALGDQMGVLDQAATVASFIEALGLERPLLVGHSLGGTIALGVATHHPEVIGGVALLAPLIQPAGMMPAPAAGAIRHGALARSAFAQTLGTPLAQASFDKRWAGIFAPEPVPDDFATRGGAALGNRPRSVEAALLEVSSVDTDLSTIAARYADLRVPVAILYGNDDRIVDPVAESEHARAVIPGVTVDTTEGGHMLPVTRPMATASFIRSSARRNGET